MRGPVSYLLINDKDKFHDKKQNKENIDTTISPNKVQTSKCNILYHESIIKKQKNDRLRELND